MRLSMNFSIGVLLACLMFSGTNAQAFMSTPDILSRLKLSLTALDQAPSFVDWEADPHHPKLLFAEVASEHSFAARNALGSALSALSNEQLVHFEDEIENYGDPKSLENKAELQEKIQFFRAKSLKRLETSMSVLNSLDTPVLPQIEMKEVEIDPARGEVFYGTDLPKDHVALTFDDGPSTKHTPRILKALKDYGVRGTFFQVGWAAKIHPEITKAVAQDNHTMGSHSYSHKDLRKMPAEEALKDILSGIKVGTDILGEVSVPFFRFPYGAYTKELQALVSARGISSFFWNMDSTDWKVKDAESVYRNTAATLAKNRHGIIVFHDTHTHTADAIPFVLREFQRLGLKAVVFKNPLIRHP